MTKRVIKMQGQATATFQLSREEVTVLMLCSTAHYDSVCREASSKGGFIERWHRYTFNEDGLGAEIQATTRELDLSLKCLEYMPGLKSEGARKTAGTLSVLFARMFAKMQLCYIHWKEEHEL